MEEVCFDAGIQQPISNEVLHYNTDDGAQLDVAAPGARI